MLPDDLRDLIARRYHVRLGAATPILGEGEECLLWRLAEPRPLVVRVSPSRRGFAELIWAFTAAATLAHHVSEVVVPLRSVDGAYVIDWAGAPVSLWPDIPGEHLDRESAEAREQAADLLGRLHRTALHLPAVGTRPRGRPADSSRAIDLDDIIDADLDRVLDRWRTNRAVAYPAGVVHGDFYRRNLLWLDGQITGLIDWDEARVDLLVAELAWATWELAKNQAGDRILPERAAAFLTAYQAAGGPTFPGDMIAPLIRHQLREEIRHSRTTAITGENHDPEYEAAEVRAFGTVADDLGGVLA